MKKSLILAGLLIASSSVMADTYIGLDYAMNSNTTDDSGSVSLSVDNKYKDISIKIGGGKDGGWKGQTRLSRITYDKSIFDSSNKTLTELGFDVIKEFKFDSIKNFYPYLKAGFGYGYMKVDGYNQSAIAEVSYKLGLGISYKAVEHLYIVGGLDYVGRKWQEIESNYGSYSRSITDSGMQPYIGMNYAF